MSELIIDQEEIASSLQEQSARPTFGGGSGGGNKPGVLWLEAYDCPTTTQQRSPRLNSLQRHQSDAAAAVPVPSAADGGNEPASPLLVMSFQRR